eukprot:7729928-Alexandrium_andersonii.AAC.1
MATGILARTPPAMRPSLLQGSLWWCPLQPSGQRGSACTASAWRTCGGAKLHMQAAPLHVRTSAVQSVTLRAL